jgi:flagellar hook assembly protein FlgD
VVPVRFLFKLKSTNGADTSVWDGRGADGYVVPNGSYNVSVTAIDAASNVSPPCDLIVGVQSAFDPSVLLPP